MIDFPLIEDLPFWIQSMFNGLVGGIIYVIVQNWGWSDLENIERRLIMGIVVGYITHITGHLDAVTTIIAGYVGIDGIEGLINRRLPEKKQPP